MEYRRTNRAEVSWVRHDDRYGDGYLTDPSKPYWPTNTVSDSWFGYRHRYVKGCGPGSRLEKQPTDPAVSERRALPGRSPDRQASAGRRHHSMRDGSL